MRDRAAAGFVRSTGNTVWWGSDWPRIERFADGELGWQVTTDCLATVLAEAARSAGARIEHARLAAEDAAAIDAPIVLDGSGRAGLVARARGWRVAEPALRTVALVAAWRHDGWPAAPDQTHTLIESYTDGWRGRCRSGDGTRHVAVMVHPRTTDLAKAQPAREIYLMGNCVTPAVRSIAARCDARRRACRAGTC